MARKNKYSEEFIKTAVSRVNAGIAQVQVANELGIKPQTLSRWCIAAKNGMSLEEKNESDEIRRLKKELEKAKGKTPIKLICPGKVYRRDDDDATHSHQFMQCEGLVVGENVTLADLKGTLEFMANRLFGEGRTIRFRPSYFPFTEPSVEVDVSCPFCNGKGCSVCKGSGWIEILGAGMVHPHVLEMNGFDPEKCSGFAFGVGLERVAMLKYGINDIRNFYTNDVRFLKTFDRFD